MVNRYNPQRRFRRYHRKNKIATDVISSLPDELLLHIISFMPTKFAIRTSLLSKCWRHIWCDTTSISIDHWTEEPDLVTETLNRFKATKMMSFHLKTNMKNNAPYINKWIKLAMKRNKENLSLHVNFLRRYRRVSNFFFINPSVKQLRVTSHFSVMSPRCITVSWTSLKDLSLYNSSFPHELSIVKILSGCPILECLRLYCCKYSWCHVKVLDLRNLMRLRTLEIKSHTEFPGPVKIVAPHIHFLRLISRFPYTLDDISSLAEAKLDIYDVSKFEAKLDNYYYISKESIFEAHFLQAMVDMVEKLQNVDKLTFSGNFLQILSIAEVRGVLFPMLNVKTLILETAIFQYVIPGIERLLQNSLELKKLIVRARNCNTIPEKYIVDYLNLQGLDPDKCWNWKSKYGVFWNRSSRFNLEAKHVTSFIELMLKNTKTLDKMFVQLDERYLGFKFNDLAPIISPNKNVSIELSTKPMILADKW